MTLKEVLIEQKNSLIFFSLFFLISCNPKKEYSREDIMKLNPTYIILNKEIKNELKKIDTNKVDFDNSSDIFVLYIEKKDTRDFAISITKTEFPFFKKYKSNYYFKTLKGYANYSNRKVLIYGDVENHLLKKTNEKLLDILYYQKSQDSLEAPVIYEPTFIDFTIR
nr:hypothetical protein [Flavobacterium sp. ASV13]